MREIITMRLKNEIKINRLLIELIDLNIIQNTVDPIVKILVSLWDGSLYPMIVSYSDTLYSLRERIKEHTGIKIDEIALSQNYDRPLCCCWNCTYGKNVLFKEIFNWITDDEIPIKINLLVKIKAVAKDYPTFKIGTYIKPNSSYPDKPAETNETCFYMTPGTVADMIEEITSDSRNTFYLKGCSFKIGFQGQILQPSQSMYEAGIRFNSEVDIIMDWPAEVTIRKQKIRCNLKDSVSELIWRYLSNRGLGGNGIPALVKGNETFPFGCEKSLEDVGIVDGDVLNYTIIQTKHSLPLDDENLVQLYFGDEDIRYVKMQYILITRQWCPVGYMRIYKSYSLVPCHKGTIDELHLSNLKILKFDRLKSPHSFGDIEY